MQTNKQHLFLLAFLARAEGWGQDELETYCLGKGGILPHTALQSGLGIWRFNFHT